MIFYKNAKTGAVVKVKSELRGGHWERIPDPSEPAPQEKTEKKTAKKKKGGETA